MKPNLSALLLVVALVVLGLAAVFRVSEASAIVIGAAGVLTLGLRERAKLSDAEKANPPAQGSTPGGSVAPGMGATSNESTEPAAIVKQLDEVEMERMARIWRTRELARDLVVAWSTESGLAGMQPLSVVSGAAWEAATTIIEDLHRREHAAIAAGEE